MNDHIEPNKSLGQHWLYDQSTLQSICGAAEVTKTDTILEIGPGLGTLTKLLCDNAQSVIAVEYDKILAANLNKNVPATNLTTIQADILDFNFEEIEGNYKIVANIPYYLTSHLIRKISETAHPPKSATLLIQKEVAERVAALPGDMSLLSVSAQYYWDVSLGIVVTKDMFTPPPKVDSQVVILTKRGKPLYEDVTVQAFFRIVKAGYSQKRKTLLNCLSSGLQLDKDVIKHACDTVEIDPQRRAQTLSLEEWHNLAVSLNT